MKREEEIRQAANASFEDIECCWGFITGAEWADDNLPQDVINLNKVWHDTSEEPNKPYPIIIEIDDDIDPTYEVITVDGIDEKFWVFLTTDRGITRWAYIADMLPKGGEA